MNLTTKDIDSGNEYVSPYVRYGVQEIRIASIEAYVSPNGKQGLKFSAEGQPNEKLNGNCPVMDTTLWLSDAAIKHTLATIRHMGEALGVENELDAINETEPEVYAKALTPLLCGKYFRALLHGKEIEGTDGKNNWFKAQIPLYVKCESLDTAETNLFFDADKHLERLAIPDAEEMAEAHEENTSDDLPF